MAKKNERLSKLTPLPRPALTDRERGMQAFTRNDYPAAIAAWTKVARAESSEAVERALAEAHFRHANQFIRSNPAQALEDLQTAADLSLTDPLYAFHVGLAYHRRGDLENAIKGYREALRRDPYYARAAYPLCLALAESGADPAVDPAWGLLTPAQWDRLLPTDDTLSTAMTLLAAGNLDKAEGMLQRTLSSAPRTGHYYLGVIAWRRGEQDEALAHWLAARAAGFDTPGLRHNLLSVYIQQAIREADSPTLSETVRAGLKISPDSPLLLTLRQRAEFMAGSRAAASGDWQHALINWQSARQQGKTSRELMINIALAYEKLERWSDAADTWREVVRRRSRRGEMVWPVQHIAYLWRHIDTLYARAGDLGKATTVLHYAIKAQPDDLTLRLALVKRYMENENWRGAETAVMRILELTPDQPEALSLHAQILDAGGDLDLMIDAWERVAATQESRQVHAARTRLITLYADQGDFYAALGDQQAATDSYEKALKLAPHDPLLHARYGALLLTSNPTQAREHFAQIDVTNEEAVFTLLSALHHAGLQAEALRWLAQVAPRAEWLVELGADIFERDPIIAERYFTRAVEQASESERPGLLTTIAVLYAAHDRKTEADTYARNALKRDSQFGPAHFNLGLWDAARGRRREAHDHLQKAQQWAQRIHRPEIADGIEEAMDLLEQRYIPTLAEILDTIDPDENDTDMRRLMGSLPSREVARDLL